MDDVAGIHQTQPDAAGDRRGDLAVIQIHFVHVNYALVGSHGALSLMHCGDLGGVDLFLNGVLLEQFVVAVQIDAGIVQHGLVLDQLALGLLQRGLIRAGIELQQQVAFMDQVAFLVMDGHQLAIHAALHCNGIDRGDGAIAGIVDADTPFVSARSHHGGSASALFLALGSHGNRAGGGTVAPLPKDEGSRRHSEQNNQHNSFPPAGVGLGCLRRFSGRGWGAGTIYCFRRHRCY